MNDSVNLLMDIDKVALGKDIFMRTPNISIPKKVEFAEDKSIMNGKVYRP